MQLLRSNEWDGECSTEGDSEPEEQHDGGPKHKRYSL